MKLVTCHSCLSTYLQPTSGARVWCNPCNQPDPRHDVHDADGTLIEQRNQRGQVVFRLRSNTGMQWHHSDRAGITYRSRVTSGEALG